MKYNKNRFSGEDDILESKISLDSLDYNSLSESDAMFKYILKKNENKKLFRDITERNKENESERNVTKINRKQRSKFSVGKRINSYKPLQIRGEGSAREGMCPHCKCFFKLKTSNYWYHLNYTHGINPRGIPYPVVDTRCDEVGYFVVCPECSEVIRLGRKPNSTFMAPYFKHFYKDHSRDTLC